MTAWTIAEAADRGQDELGEPAEGRALLVESARNYFEALAPFGLDHASLLEAMDQPLPAANRQTDAREIDQWLTGLKHLRQNGLVSQERYRTRLAEAEAEGDTHVMWVQMYRLPDTVLIAAIHSLRHIQQRHSSCHGCQLCRNVRGMNISPGMFEDLIGNEAPTPADNGAAAAFGCTDQITAMFQQSQGRRVKGCSEPLRIRTKLNQLEEIAVRAVRETID